MRDRIICGTPKRGPRDDDGGDGLPERQAEDLDREHADEDRGELEVGRHPGPEQVERPAVPFPGRDVLGAPWFDLGDLAAVGSLANLPGDAHDLIRSPIRAGRPRWHGSASRCA